MGHSSRWASDDGTITTELEMRYRADITAGALKVPETRIIADLLLNSVEESVWKEAIIERNVLQARSPATASRLTKLIRSRLETMGPDLWTLVRRSSASQFSSRW